MSMGQRIDAAFHQAFAAWLRIEPRCRSNDFASGLEVRTADPLWMLARQWQTGEFQAEDAGSPLSVKFEYSTQSVDHVKLGESTSIRDLTHDRNGSNTTQIVRPLEREVEQEWFPLNWRARIQIGQQFERFLKKNFVNQGKDVIEFYRTIYPLVPPTGDKWTAIDYATRRFLSLMKNRVIDGKALLKVIKPENGNTEGGVTDILKVPETLTDEQSQQLEQAKSEFNEWFLRLYGRSTPQRALAWRNQQLDYRFELNPPVAGGEQKTRLVAPSYRNGALDWYTANIAGVAQRAWTNQTPDGPIRAHARPITAGGLSPRWWEFEDANLNFGNLDVAKPDLAKLLLMEFVLVYGDDWFSFPLPVPMANLVRIDSLFIHNAFNEVISTEPLRKKVEEQIRRARRDTHDPKLRWELFTLSALSPIDGLDGANPEHPGVADILFVPPVTGFREESPKPVEEIAFFRDEGANKIWGVERTVLNAMGQPVHGFDAQRERHERERKWQIRLLEERIREIERELAANNLEETVREELEEERKAKKQELTTLGEGDHSVGSGVPLYRLATTVPENWFPFLPTNANALFGFTDRKIMRLRRGQMLRNVEDEEATAITAMSRLMDLEDDPLLWLEEGTVLRSGVRVLVTAHRIRWVDGETYTWYGRKVLTGGGEGSSGLEFDVVKEN